MTAKNTTHAPEEDFNEDRLIPANHGFEALAYNRRTRTCLRAPVLAWKRIGAVFSPVGLVNFVTLTKDDRDDWVFSVRNPDGTVFDINRQQAYNDEGEWTDHLKILPDDEWIDNPEAPLEEPEDPELIEEAKENLAKVSGKSGPKSTRASQKPKKFKTRSYWSHPESESVFMVEPGDPGPSADDMTAGVEKITRTNFMAYRQKGWAVLVTNSDGIVWSVTPAVDVDDGEDLI